jgi:alkaline phosphatase D
MLKNDASNVTVEGTVPYFSHETERYIKASRAPVCVDWKVSLSPDMSGQAVSQGKAYTTSDIDYTIKVGPLHCTIAKSILTGYRLKQMV